MMSFDQVAEIYRQLQLVMCAVLEKADGKASFSLNHWNKEVGNGITAVMQQGKHIEKAGLNYSNVSGPVNSSLKQILGEEAKSYQATGISSIVHAHNPYLPTIHMNVRYFALDNGTCWFGGGIDLTPAYIDISQAAEFHRKIKLICDKYNPHFYESYKKWADEYFYLPHRNETRGIGGIFFDRQKPDREVSFEKWLAFTQDIAQNYPLIYSDLIQLNSDKPYGDAEKSWQKIRRGRYVEFNLLYDRGTRFGIESGGNTESILISLPPVVEWSYNYPLKTNSPEENTQNLLKKNIDWISMSTRAET